MDETSDISRTEQVSLCLSYVVVGFFKVKSTEGHVLYDLLKDVITKLDISKIVTECFDRAANMSGVHKGLTTLMKETSPMSIYNHCYGHLINFAIQDTMENVMPLRNPLGTIQGLYNFLEASPK